MYVCSTKGVLRFAFCEFAGLIFGGAYTWGGGGGLIFEILRYFVKQILKILNLSKNSSSKLFSEEGSRSIIDI